MGVFRSKYEVSELLVWRSTMPHREFWRSTALRWHSSAKFPKGLALNDRGILFRAILFFPNLLALNLL